MELDKYKIEFGILDEEENDDDEAGDEEVKR